jgi:hypothetical protein
MPGKATSESDSTAVMSYPPIVCEQPDDVQSVIPLPGYRLAVRFFDGTSGLIEMRAMIESREAGVFEALRDPATFNAVRIDLGAVSWPNGADLAPDAMHAALAAHGEWRLA